MNDDSLAFIHDMVEYQAYNNLQTTFLPAPFWGLLLYYTGDTSTTV